MNDDPVDIISIAIGVVMERHHCSSVDATSLLMRWSRNTGVPVLGVARTIVDDVRGRAREEAREHTVEDEER